MTDIPGVCFGSPIGRPLASREEAEKGALGGLALLGAPLQPADDYEPEDLDGRKPIRVACDLHRAICLTRKAGAEAEFRSLTTSGVGVNIIARRGHILTAR